MTKYGTVTSQDAFIQITESNCKNENAVSAMAYIKYSYMR
jgi:hypothetical protein